MQTTETHAERIERVAAASKHQPAYRVSAMFKDGASRCACGWVSKTSTPARANNALSVHIGHQVSREMERELRSMGTDR